MCLHGFGIERGSDARIADLDIGGAQIVEQPPDPDFVTAVLEPGLITPLQ